MAKELVVGGDQYSPARVWPWRIQATGQKEESLSTVKGKCWGLYEGK